jgi:hypothetical protein
VEDQLAELPAGRPDLEAVGTHLESERAGRHDGLGRHGDGSDGRGDNSGDGE